VIHLYYRRSIPPGDENDSHSPGGLKARRSTAVKLQLAAGQRVNLLAGPKQLARLKLQSKSRPEAERQCNHGEGASEARGDGHGDQLINSLIVYHRTEQTASG